MKFVNRLKIAFTPQWVIYNYLDDVDNDDDVDTELDVDKLK